jgi:hypothetical protein
MRVTLVGTIEGWCPPQDGRSGPSESARKCRDRRTAPRKYFCNFAFRPKFMQIGTQWRCAMWRMSNVQALTFISPLDRSRLLRVATRRMSLRRLRAQTLGKSRRLPAGGCCFRSIATVRGASAGSARARGGNSLRTAILGGCSERQINILTT